MPEEGFIAGCCLLRLGNPEWEDLDHSVICSECERDWVVLADGEGVHYWHSNTPERDWYGPRHMRESTDDDPSQGEEQQQERGDGVRGEQ